MARQQGIIRFTGRLGNTVGYLAKDGKGNSFDASRVLAAQVTNPQTVAQMTQRMKMAPVVNFYRGLRSLLDHSWQGVKYGEPSRLFFYSQTLRALSTAGVPYIVKGDKQFVPWSFPISVGSIPTDLNFVYDDDNGMVLNNNLSSQETIQTVSELSEVLLGVLGIKNGQQITVIKVYDKDGIYIPAYARFVVNDSDETPLEDVGIAVDNTANSLVIQLQPNAGDDPLEANYQVVAAGIIVSELVNGAWQRNAASMAITNTLRTLYNSQAAFDAMLASYRTTTNSNESDWYLNGGGDEGGSTVSTVKEVTLDTDSGNKTIAYYKVGATKYAPYYDAVDGGQPIINGYRKGGDMAFTKTGANTLGSGGFVDDLKTEYRALGYTLCTRDELLAIAPDLTIPA